MSLTASFGAAEVKALGFNGVLELLNINPVMLAISALIAVVGVAAFAYDQATTSLKEHKQALDDAKQSFSDLESEGKDLADQLQTTSDRIKELQDLSKNGTITLTDKDELSRLERENAELEKKIELNKILQASAQEESTKEFVSTASSYLNQTSSYYDPTQQQFVGYTQKQALEDNLKQIIPLQHQLEAANNAYLASLKTETGKEQKAAKDKVDELQKTYDLAIGVISDGSKELQSFADTITWSENAIPGSVQDQANQMLSWISDFNNEILKKLDGENAGEIIFNSVWNDQRFTKAHDELQSLADDSELTADKIKDLYDSDDAVKDLIDKLAEFGLIDLSNFTNLANQITGGDGEQGVVPALNSLSESMQALSDAKDTVSTIGSVFKELSEDDAVSFTNLEKLNSTFADSVPSIGIYVNALSKAKTNTKETDKILSDLTYSILETKIGTENLANSTSSYISAMLRESGVANSDQAAIELITQAKSKLEIQTALSNGTIQDYIGNLKSEAENAGVAESALASLVAEQIIVNSAGLDFDQQIQALENLAMSAYGAASSYDALATALTGSSSSNGYVGGFQEVSGKSENDAQQSVLSKFSSFFKKSSKPFTKVDYSGSLAKDKSGGGSETELYVADIDKLYASKEKLTEIQNEIKKIQSLNEVTTDDQKKVENLNKIIDLYKQEQTVLHSLNEQGRNVVSQNVSKLRGMGFDVLYDPDKNKLIIENMEHINKLSGGTVEETNKLRKAAESLIDTTQSANNDNISRSQDWLSLLKDINDAYGDIKDSAKEALDTAKKNLESTVNKVFDKLSESLNKQKEAYEKQKSNLEAVASTVNSYINDYIDSLQAENDELDKQISLQEKLEALDKARTQRNKRIFKSGVGYVWSADQSEVNSAQQEYDSALREYNLNQQIQDLKDYADAWQKAVDSYETSSNEALASSILGSNWKSKILGTNYSTIKDFKTQYAGVLSQLDENVYGSVAYQIQNLDDLKDKWSDSVDDANDTSTNYKDVLDFISTYESDNYTTRLSSLSTFVSNAINKYKSLSAAAEAASGVYQVQSNGNAPAGLKAGDYVNTAGGVYQIVAAGTQGATYNSKSGYWSIKAYSDGGIVDYTGLASVHGGSGHNEIMLNSDSANTVWKYIKSGDMLANSAAMLMMANKIGVSNSSTPSTDQTISLNIGDIYLSGVNDSGSLADAIIKRLPSQIIQKFRSK